ncbi:MAG: hypothetical protein H7243_02915 [Sphingomonadaceae bacterium]|nr:hypothetical protein [Sphingomonadaceae bacterium]
MKPLSFADLWHDTLADTRALLPLAWPVAAAFVLLPQVAIDRFGPPLPMVKITTARVPAPPAASPKKSVPPVSPAARPLFAQIPPNVLLIDLLLPALIGLLAQGTIIRLALDRRRRLTRSVGEALTTVARAWPLLVVMLGFATVPIGFGLLAFVLPGLYLAGRLAPATALVLDGAGPVAALERSWALTIGNGWRVIGFTLVFFGWFIIVSAATGVVGAGAAAMLKAAGAGGLGEIIAASLDGAVAALAAVFNAVALATIYRHLTR